MDPTQQVAGSPAARPSPPPGEERDRLVRLAYRFLWNREDAEDVAQEALLRAHGRRDELRDSSAWWSWLCRIVVRRCHDLARGRVLWAKHGPRFALRQTGREPTSPENLRASREGSEALREALMLLPPRQKEVVVLRHLEGLSYEAIGELLGISPATARVHAKAGLEGLRESLRGPDFDEG